MLSLKNLKPTFDITLLCFKKFLYEPSAAEPAGVYCSKDDSRLLQMKFGTDLSSKIEVHTPVCLCLGSVTKRRAFAVCIALLCSELICKYCSKAAKNGVEQKANSSSHHRLLL